MKLQFSLLSPIIFILFFCTPSFAQIKIGPGIAFGTEIENIGITVKGHYDINETWQGAGSFTYFFSGEESVGVDLDLWELNFDAHYLLSSNEQFTFYPLVGLSIAGVSIDLNTGIPGFDGKTSTTETGINIGAGIELNISEKITGVAETKYVLGGFDQLVLNAGILFAIGNN